MDDGVYKLFNLLVELNDFVTESDEEIRQDIFLNVLKSEYSERKQYRTYKHPKKPTFWNLPNGNLVMIESC